jgi:hypothetical protein
VKREAKERLLRCARNDNTTPAPAAMPTVAAIPGDTQPMALKTTLDGTTCTRANCYNLLDFFQNWVCFA